MLGDGLHDIPAGKVAMAVTHLEMHAPADLRPVPAPDGVTFRQIRPDANSYRDLFRRVGTDWLWYGRLKLDDATLTAIFDDPAIQLYTLTLEGRDEAMLELDFRVQGQCELAYFGLTSALIGAGAGRYLMNKAIALAWSHSIIRLHVHTCNFDSPKALDFYIRSGFTPYRRQVEVDDDPRVLGILPETAAPHVPVIRA